MTHAIISDATPVYGETVEVLRNLALNPLGAATLGFSANSANYESARGVTVPVDNPQGIAMGVRGKSNIGGTTVMSLYNVDALSNTAPARQIGAWFWTNRSGLVATFRAGDTITPLAVSSWTWATGFVPASVFAGANVYKADGVATDAGALAYITGVTVFADDVPTAAVAGGTPYPDPDLVPSWTGTPNASPSILSLTPVLIPSVTNPLAVAGYATKRESRNVVSVTLDGGIGVAHFAPRLRNSTLTTVYDAADAAWEAYAMYGRGQHFTLYPDDAPAAQMRFVLDGDLKIAQDSDDPAIWFVDIDYQEVPA